MDTAPLIRTCHETLMSFGYFVLIAARDEMERRERYEACAAIDFVLSSRTGKPANEYPRHIDDAAMEDYRTEFWRLGHSGETAISNFDAYLKTALLAITDADAQEHPVAA